MCYGRKVIKKKLKKSPPSYLLKLMSSDQIENTLKTKDIKNYTPNLPSS